MFCTFTLVLSEVCVQWPMWVFSVVPWIRDYYYYYYYSEVRQEQSAKQSAVMLEDTMPSYLRFFLLLILQFAELSSFKILTLNVLNFLCPSHMFISFALCIFLILFFIIIMNLCHLYSALWTFKFQNTISDGRLLVVYFSVFLSPYKNLSLSHAHCQSSYTQLI